MLLSLNADLVSISGGAEAAESAASVALENVAAMAVTSNGGADW